MFRSANREIHPAYTAGWSRGGVPGGGLQVFEGFAEEAGGAAGTVVDAFANFRMNDLDYGANQRARVVILAAVPSGVSHVFDLAFVEMGQLVFFRLRAEAQFVDMIDDFAQVVAGLDLVFDFAEDFADFVFDGVGAAGALLETLEIGEEFAVDEVG